jgi:tripartite-type tricarboxylate transporter receptor subunit TctC
VLQGFENSGWFGLVAPANVPHAIVQKIAVDSKTALEDPELRSKLDTMGFRIVASAPDAMARAMSEERRRWSVLVKERNIRSE